jgi:hypothetical protein
MRMGFVVGAPPNLKFGMTLVSFSARGFSLGRVLPRSYANGKLFVTPCEQLQFDKD